MIEVYTVTDSNKFTYYNEKARKGENQGDEFSELVRNTGVEPVYPRPLSTGYEEEVDETMLYPDMEMVSYTFSGEKLFYRRYTGRNVDIEV